MSYFPETFNRAALDKAKQKHDQRDKAAEQEELLKRYSRNLVKEVDRALKDGNGRIEVYLPPTMTNETKLRFYRDLENKVGAESLSLFFGMELQSNPPQLQLERWDLQRVLQAHSVHLII